MDYLIAIFIVLEHSHQSIMNFCLKTLDKNKTSMSELTSQVPNVNCCLKIIPLSAAHKSEVIVVFNSTWAFRTVNVLLPLQLYNKCHLQFTLKLSKVCSGLLGTGGQHICIYVLGKKSIKHTVCIKVYWLHCEFNSYLLAIQNFYSWSSYILNYEAKKRQMFNLFFFFNPQFIDND